MNHVLEPAPLTDTTFSPERTREVLRLACRRAGLKSTGATVLRHHTNAVYLLAEAPVVVKIGRPSRRPHLTDAVEFVRWLEHQAVPTISLLPHVRQPMIFAGCPITFWRYLPQQRPIRAPELASPLSRLHTAPLPAMRVPDHRIDNVFASIANSIEASRFLPPDERALLHRHRNELIQRASTVRFDLPRGVIHGDAHHHNALHDDTGAAVLCDWDDAAVGPPEWDLVTLEVHCRRFSHPATDYDQFCVQYGLDIRDWQGYPWLRDLRELRMITTNARKSSPNTPAANEVLDRIRALRSRATTTWSIL